MYNLSPGIGAKQETQGADTTNSRGTTVSASGSANVKGSWTSIGSATGFDYEMITVMMHRGGQSSFLVDIGIQENSGDRVVCSNIYVPNLPHSFLPGVNLNLPIHIPLGSQLRCRCQASTASNSVSVSIIGSSRGIARAAGYAYMDSYPATATAGSLGFQIDHGTTANTKSTWRTITSSLTRPASELLIMCGGATDIARAATQSSLLDIGFGTATDSLKISNIMYSAETLGDTQLPTILGMFPVDIDAGSIISARVQSTATAAGDRIADFMIYTLGGA